MITQMMSGALLAVSVGILAAPSALAVEGSAGAAVVPSLTLVDGSTAKPGQAVHAQIVCDADDPAVGSLVSPVLDSRQWHRDAEGHQPLARFAAAVVKPSAAPGRYPVTATCAGRRLTTTITVAPTGSRSSGHQVARVPTGAPQTGGGVADQSGVDPAALAVGLGAGGLAGGAAVGLVTRQARRGRNRANR